jgi:hypothetical protein
MPTAFLLRTIALISLSSLVLAGCALPTEPTKVPEKPVLEPLGATTPAPSLSETTAQNIAAAATICTDVGTVGATEVYNPNSQTWWFTLQQTVKQAKPGCKPACVVSVQTQTASVNWRCTGLHQVSPAAQ